MLNETFSVIFKHRAFMSLFFSVFLSTLWLSKIRAKRESIQKIDARYARVRPK